MDRISQLPESILHHILSFLNTWPAELVRMSVLSKPWFNLTASFPILNFSIYDFKHAYRHSFFKYVEYTISRFCHQNLTLHTLKLTTTIRNPAELDVVNRCLELILKKGVQVLLIHITNNFSAYKYQLPNILLSSFMVDAVKFKSLVQLKLANVQIDDEVIKYFTTSCPLLQVFGISGCQGFDRFCVYGHQNLQEVRITYRTPVERIDIDAPNLSTLLVADFGESGPPQMKLASCKKLTKVAYIGHPLLNSDGFADFLSNFPFIEKLVLYADYRCNNLKLSSHSLRTLVLHSSCDLEDIEFKTPNLVSFIYTSSFSRSLSLLRDSTQLKGWCMHWYPGAYIDTQWFQKLRRFFGKKNGFKVFNLYIHARYSQNFIVKAVELPPYELEHVELQLETHIESSNLLDFVDVVLWYCRPRSLTLSSSFPLIGFEEIVKFTCKKLLEQEDQCHTNVRIVWPSFPEAKKHSRDLKSLSTALPRAGKTVSFIKEKVVQQAAV